MSSGDTDLQHGGCEGACNSPGIYVVVNSVTATEEVQKVSVGGDWSLCDLGVETSGQLFEDKHGFSTIILLTLQT
jgi:hypothetical protein